MTIYKLSYYLELRNSFYCGFRSGAISSFRLNFGSSATKNLAFKRTPTRAKPSLRIYFVIQGIIKFFMFKLKKINKFVLLFLIFYFCFIGSSVQATTQRYLNINLNKNNKGIIRCNSVNVLGGELNLPKDYDRGDYRAELVSFDNKVLKSVKFNFGLYSANIKFPYYKNIKEIDIYNQNNKKALTKDINFFANLCGDKICQPHESYENCPQDCFSGTEDGFCDKIKDGICDPDCQNNQDIDCLKKAEFLNINSQKNRIGFIVISLLFLGIIIFIIKKLIKVYFRKKY